LKLKKSPHEGEGSLSVGEIPQLLGCAVRLSLASENPIETWVVFADGSHEGGVKFTAGPDAVEARW
jgi:hypothetical protein